MKIKATIGLESGFSHILFNLSAQGYAAVKVEYSGGGDEGSIESMTLLKAGTVNFTDEGVEEADSKDGGELYELDDDLYELISSKVDDEILQNASDWWNNEGGGGTLWISTYDAKYHGDHYINVISREDQILTGQMKD